MKIVNGSSYIPQVKKMIEESKAEGVINKLSFFENELSEVEKNYLPPNGDLIVAIENNEFYGMVAYVRVSDARCMMQRLYVRREARGQHLGDSLVKEIISRAKTAGFIEMVAEAPSEQVAAVSLYRKYDFEDCEPFTAKPQSGVKYMLKDLTV